MRHRGGIGATSLSIRVNIKYVSGHAEPPLCVPLSDHTACQDGHFFAVQSEPAVRQDSCLPARAAHRRPDITSHTPRACGDTLKHVSMRLLVSPPVRGRLRGCQRGAERVGGSFRVFSLVRKRKKTAHGRAAPPTIQGEARINNCATAAAAAAPIKRAEARRRATDRGEDPTGELTEGELHIFLLCLQKMTIC